MITQRPAGETMAAVAAPEEVGEEADENFRIDGFPRQDTAATDRSVDAATQTENRQLHQQFTHLHPIPLILSMTNSIQIQNAPFLVQEDSEGQGRRGWQ